MRMMPSISINHYVSVKTLITGESTLALQAIWTPRIVIVKKKEYRFKEPTQKTTAIRKY